MPEREGHQGRPAEGQPQHAVRLAEKFLQVSRSLSRPHWRCARSPHAAGRTRPPAPAGPWLRAPAGEGGSELGGQRGLRVLPGLVESQVSSCLRQSCFLPVRLCGSPEAFVSWGKVTPSLCATALLQRVWGHSKSDLRSYKYCPFLVVLLGILITTMCRLTWFVTKLL